MKTTTATGLSMNRDSRLAIQEAVGAARPQLEGDLRLVIVFASPDRDLAKVLEAASDASPGAQVVGCTTAGELTERGLVHGGVAVMLIAGALDVEVELAATTDVERAAAQLCAGFERRQSTARRSVGPQSTMLLVDGLSGSGEAVVDSVRQRMGGLQEIVGGAAGDEGRFAATWVGANGRTTKAGAVVAHAFGEVPWGVGVDHGLQPVGERLRVTKVKGNVVYELDGRPAFEAYQAFAERRKLELTPANAARFMIDHELGVFGLDGQTLRKARAPLAKGADGSLTCAASVPPGATVSILDGRVESLVNAARNAAQEARDRMRGHPAAGVLMFDCICRGTMLENRFQEEIDAVRSVFPDSPVLGFLTYGEIARYSGRLDGWHNSTLVVAAIPA